MKYIQRTTKNIKDNFLKNLLIDREIIPENDIDYQDRFFNPTKDNLIESTLLDDIKLAADVIENHIKKGSKIYIIVDADMDGFTSSASLYNYIEKNYRDKYPDYTIDYHIPDGKEHGLNTLMDDLTEYQKYDLIILPDAGSNDIEEHKILHEMGYDIVCLDHHEVSQPSNYAIVVNNQSSPNYPNKSLSGVGVVYKFLQLLDRRNNWNDADTYLDLVAAGQAGDMMNLNTIENRYITNYGLGHIRNEGLRQLVKLQGYSIFGKYSADITDEFLNQCSLTPINVSFYIAPLINALIRVGTNSEKEILFKSFVNGSEIVPSTKRGHKGEFETIAEQNARNCSNARARQNKEKDKALDLLDIQICNNCLDENKIMILNADELDTPNTLTGLCAMGVAAKYKKPVLLGRITPDGKYLKGSMRGQNESELKDFRQFLLSSNLMEYVEGHAGAAGFGIKISNVSKLYDYANEELKNIDFKEGFYEADFIIDGNCSYLSDMIKSLDKGKGIYGQDCPEPLIVVQNIIINKNNIQVMGSNKDTLKITFNNMSYMKFKASDLIQELEQYGDNKISLTIIGRGNINTWGGRIIPQIFIDDIEIKESSMYDF